MNQEKFDLIKTNCRYTYLHRGRLVYCLIHPTHLSDHNGYRLDSLQKFFDKEDGSVYYETYEQVTIREVSIDELLKVN